MRLLTLDEIREWTSLHESRLRNPVYRKYPPKNNPVYDSYFALKMLLEYYAFKGQCDEALSELERVNFYDLVCWTQDYEELGNEELFGFLIEYFDWIEEVDDDKTVNVIQA
ncbi:MAG: hypothetical protein J5I50_02140 [Chitinophagaceae bacterium]|nr:hypothetical protein [Chitinophagaceae bacterium]